jgi:hypothetical protein
MVVPGGCGTTPLRRGPPPSWAAPAFVDSRGSKTARYALASRGTAMAYVGRLRAGHPTNPANKVLWIVHPPRGRSDLVIRARPLRASAPLVTIRRRPDSGPGPIYPSYVNVPSPGCWHLTLRWAGNVDTLDLAYAPR